MPGGYPDRGSRGLWIGWTVSPPKTPNSPQDATPLSRQRSLRDARAGGDGRVGISGLGLRDSGFWDFGWV